MSRVSRTVQFIPQVLRDTYHYKAFPIKVKRTLPRNESRSD